MKNMGPKSSEWLASVGIHTLDDVAKLGVVEAYKRVKAAYPEKVTLNMLWGLQAALLGLPWNELPSDIKEELRRQVDPLPSPPPNTP
ncbi:MAG TPA: TfoX/Sxy family protein [Anaerolineales bacterium]|nr:TfoX/Sxy family protein [Anaerolineales bacterium]